MATPPPDEGARRADRRGRGRPAEARPGLLRLPARLRPRPRRHALQPGARRRLADGCRLLLRERDSPPRGRAGARPGGAGARRRAASTSSLPGRFGARATSSRSSTAASSCRIARRSRSWARTEASSSAIPGTLARRASSCGGKGRRGSSRSRSSPRTRTGSSSRTCARRSGALRRLCSVVTTRSARRARSTRSTAPPPGPSPSTCQPPRVKGAPHDLRPGPGPLRANALQPLRPQRPAAPGHLTRTLEQLRLRPPFRDGPCDRAARLRPRDHPLRPRQQLWTAVRLGRGELRPHARARPRPVPRRARDLDQGRL